MRTELRGMRSEGTTVRRHPARRTSKDDGAIAANRCSSIEAKKRAHGSPKCNEMGGKKGGNKEHFNTLTALQRHTLRESYGNSFPKCSLGKKSKVCSGVCKAFSRAEIRLRCLVVCCLHIGRRPLRCVYQ